jgi:hypothetical protein
MMHKWNCETGLLVGEPWNRTGERIGMYYAMVFSSDGKTIASETETLSDGTPRERLLKVFGWVSRKQRNRGRPNSDGAGVRPCSCVFTFR